MSKSALELFDYMEKESPEFFQAFMAENEVQFAEATVLAIGKALSTMETGAKQLTSQDELGLSNYLANLLKHAMFSATSETYSKGHVDVQIRSVDGQHLLLCECKKWAGTKYHVAGCGQLLGYMTGRNSFGVLVEFFGLANMYLLLSELKNYFDHNKPEKQQGLTTSLPVPKGSFRSSHEHSSGAVIAISHLGCNLFTSSHR